MEHHTSDGLVDRMPATNVNSNFPNATGTNGMDICRAVTASTPSEAITYGLVQDPLGYEGGFLTVMREKLLNLHKRGLQYTGLNHALDYACRWAFVVGHKIVFDARLGLLPVGDNSNVAIFFSFEGPENGKQAGARGVSAPGEATGSSLHVGAIQTGMGVEPAAGDKQGLKGVGMSHATKSWVAERILGLMLRYYGDVPFPTMIWLMEEGREGREPTLLLSHALGVPGDSPFWGRCSEAGRRVIQQIIYAERFNI